MPLQNSAGRKEACFSANGINGTKRFTEIPSTTASNGSPAAVIQKVEIDHDRVPHSNGELRKPDSGSAAAAEHLEQIWEWNGTAPESVERCVHDLIIERVRAQPTAPAVCAWDGELTYSELDDLATKLASRLRRLGVGPDILVPLCFEKSMWTTVAVLGVIKAGGAFVLLDPSLPEQRLQVIVHQLQANVIVSSSSKGEVSSRLAKSALVINWEFFTSTESANIDDTVSQAHPANPASLLYAVFTSGSTGMPKGVLITNKNAASALYHQAEFMGMNQNARIFDFASYSFDVSVSNVLSALATGGCLCVPSDQDRKDNLERSIASLEANILDITPSMAQVLSPDRIPSVNTVIFGGEALHPADIKRWWGKVNIIHIYGPCECTPTSTINHSMAGPGEAVHMGKGVGLVTWIVDPEDHETLLAPGYTGELLLEGPLVGRGYLNDDAKTAALFIKDPEWLLRGTSTKPGRRGRLYKTGDLVQYTSNGCLKFVGRKQAAQVKIRGQRLELGEIEHTLRNHANVDEAVAALQHEEGQESRIVSFVTVRDVGSIDSLTDNIGEVKRRDEWKAHCDGEYVSGMDHRDLTDQPLNNGKLQRRNRQEIHDELFGMLKSQLPLYMVPQVIEILDRMPLNRNGKIDRLALVKGLEGRASARGPIRQPVSEAQRLMLQVWAQVLKIEASTIGTDASFFHLGGSSISAMKVVAEAREIGMNLSVADIFRYPILHELVDQSHHESPAEKPDQVVVPFALLSNETSLNTLLQEICIQYDLGQIGGTAENTFIQDAYPCTPLQEGLMSLTSMSPGAYIGQNVLEISPDASIENLCAAWEQIVRRLPILRTRLVHHDRVGLVQIVINEPINWIEANSLDDYIKSDIQRPMDLGQPLTRFALIKDATGSPRWFVLTIHHALYDGWSMPLILDAVKKVYRGGEFREGPQFQAFVKYVKSQDRKMMRDYWLDALEDCQCAPFPGLPPHIEKPMTNKSAQYSFPKPQSNRLGITPPIMIRAAWALLVGKMTSTEDVVFGVTLFGRNVPLPGIEMVAGPTFATVPVRIKWNRNDTAVEYLKAAQHQATGMIPFEQIGLHKLAELSPETRQACRFQTLVVIQPEEASDGSDELGTWKGDFGQGDRIDSYGLVLILQLGADTVRVSASFDSRMIEPWRVDKLLSRLGHVVFQLDQASPELLLSDVETITPQELEQIWNWNHAVPIAAEQCVHKLFEQTAQAQPDASAVCAWDGEWTYRDLDEASSRIAHYLVILGVGLEQIVPLCFEKSRWTPVAMLAVMKAGGASVALDSTQPEERLRTIVQQTEPALMLSSSASQELASRLSRQHVVVVDDGLLARLKPVSGTCQLPVVTPSNKLYVAFTSGSTGVPKGAVITHRNFSSAIQHMRNSRCAIVDPTARVYDFASYAFDISWFNSLQSLTNGACLCIPSEADRRNDLAGSIHRLQATFAILTPSTANILPLETICSLRTLMLAGEALPSEYAKRWLGLTRLTNGYGPCECTPITTVAAIEGTKVVASSIGRGVGVNTWVVQASDHNRLVPIGDVGELMLEGPLVGCGYIGDAEQTTAAFIQDPTWLRHGASGFPGRQGRLYKTGDLVRYNSDGSLVFVGRKDANQVKIRGQRVELGDVEHHVHVSIPAARQVAAEVILPADANAQGRPTLAAFLVVEDQPGLSSEVQVMSVSAEVHHELTKRLPGYMVPSVYFSLHELPTNSSGKIDRRRLRELGAGFTVQQLAQLQSASVSNKRAPANEMERTLQKIWARVLGVDADKIGSDDSFFRLGGDSITAMQASAASRALGLNISTADIMRSKTISLIAAAASSSKHHFPEVGKADPKKDDGQPFALSPIQRLYVAMQSHPTQCFDLKFFLKMRQPISFASLSKATEKIVMRHPMLRARFILTSKGVWKQRIIDDASHSFHLSEVVGTESVSSSKAHDIRRCRERLNIETGPILAAVLFSDQERQSLFITVHHLVIDLVSWRILLEELEDLLSGRELSTSPTTSFQRWCSLQAQYALQNLQQETKPGVKPPLLSYWGLKIDDNVQGAIALKEFTIDEEASSAILGACNEAFGTRPVELMIAALIYSFSTVFTDRTLPTVFSEGHGREPWDDRIDLSRVIGWFTTISPAFVPSRELQDLVETIRLTKDSVRRLSKNGWSYFTSQYADEHNAATNATDFPVEVLFNFAGSYQQLERDDSFFESTSISEDCHPESWLKLRRFALFEFNAHVDQGRLAVSLEYPKSTQHGDLIERWAVIYETTLKNLGALLNNRSPEWTLSDFPLAFTSYTDLEEFRSVTLGQLGLENAQDIEDIFPCTGLQEGLLFAQFKALDNYRVALNFEITATETPGDHVDLLRIERAWQAVVRRHTLLRCILVDMVPGSSRTMHVVLKDPKPSISFDRSASEASVDRGFVGGRTCVKYDKYGLQHHLSVSCIDEKHVRICFELNHVILDGHSTGVMLHDFWQAYTGTLSLDAPSYGDFIRYVEKQPRGADRDFWVKYLEGVKPCFFPPSKSATGEMKDITVSVPGLEAFKVHDFCAKWEVATASVIQTAWALVLYHFTGCTSPCFGNLASCRDVPIDRLGEMFGPVIAMIPYRVRLDGSHSVVETLREAQKDYVDSLPHQMFSLMEIHEALDVGSSGLFNSILSFQRVAEQPDASVDGHIIQERSAHDPVEYPISLSVGDSDTELSIEMTFKAGFIPNAEADRVAKAMGAAVSSLISEPHKKISNDSLLTRDDLELIWSWNSEVPAEDMRAHNVFEEQSTLRSEAVTVCAEEVVTIVKGAGLVTWVVDPKNHDSLLPPGCVGELLLEGPLAVYSDLCGKVKSDAAFIKDPKWLLMGVPGKQKGRHGRLYKTGYLVRYNVDGSLVFIGRKEDTQAKINGQTIELEEVEYWAQNHMSDAKHVVAEVIKPQGADLSSNSLLAMFVQLKDETIDGNEPDARIKLLPIPADVEGRLAKHLPVHMMPSLLLSVSELPKTMTGNIDRKRLREMAAQFSIEQLETARSSGRSTSRRPTSEAERVMQKIWAKILDVSIDGIGPDDNFFHLGGDSILSMRLVSEARKVHMNITVADVFHRKTLAELVNGQHVNGVESGPQLGEVALVDSSTREALSEEIVSISSDICHKDIADILPVTSVQERCFVEGIYPVMCINQDDAVSGTSCGRFANYVYIDLPENTDVPLLEEACKRTLSQFPILRACFLQLQGKFWQVVLHQIRHPFRVQDVSENLDVALHNFCLSDAHSVSATLPPVSLVLLRHKTQGGRLIIRISHAQYDGVCLPTIIASFINGHVPTPLPPSFSSFLSHASLRRPKSIEYWKKLLQGSQQPGHLREHLLAQTDIHTPQPEAIYIRAETSLPRLPGNITPATLASAAWALLLSRLTGRGDVVYGHLVAGRNSEIGGIDKTVGCCLNFIPVRVTFPSTQTPTELLLAVQEQFLAVGEADSLGYREIIENCTDWPPGSTFESTIQHQNIDENPQIQSAAGISRVQFFQNPHLVPMSIHMVSETRGNELCFELNSNTHIMRLDAAKAMIDGLISIIDEFKSAI
ncbi:nonribosomal peptide synthase, putative [Metarhizium acridum CQMa 102]|uniref:Nonribosomal peptide synthase, putative n=1 Tax=Metarhizium acridum (strain CQMa 102) TaxID=655827 RepID=E9E6A0_METAQ|nr:nonribosomal peptide synthase, putative [Metarhizium acridum CQMa 102]EFY88504.1 nonribosomal peptide synthase, putative [Metarhizium acridum CQMa 102]